MPASITARKFRRRVPQGAWQRCGQALGSSWMNSDDQSLAQLTAEQTQKQLVSEELDCKNTTCTRCASEMLMGDDGLLVCSSAQCGYTIARALDSTPEWRFRNEGSDDPARCGIPMNPLLQESSYGCKLTGANKSVQMRKLGKYASWQSMPYHEKALHDGFEDIRRAASHAGLPKRLIQEAYKIHKLISEERSFRGVNRQGIIAAALYLSCRSNGCPRTAKEIATMFSLDPAHTTRGCKNALSVLSLIERDNKQTNEKTVFPKMQSSHYIDRFCCRTGLNDELTRLAKFIALKVDQEQLVPENTPHSVAAGIVWFVCQLTKTKISKRSAAGACDVSEVTISKCFKKLEAAQSSFLPPIIVKKYSS